MKIFISHIREEFQVALVLKKWIEAVFGDQGEILVSSDPENIPTVSQWVERDDPALSEVKALIILCSPNSMQKPWISFEAGCAWIKKISIIPVCHSGLSSANLPSPLSMFLTLEMNQKDFSKKLFSTLAQELGVSELPAIQHQQMRGEIRQVLETVRPMGWSPSQGAGGPGAQPLEPIHEQILLVLADSYGFTSAVLAEHFKMSEQEILPNLKRLIEDNYVYASPAGMGHIRFNITGRGRDYLRQQKFR